MARRPPSPWVQGAFDDLLTDQPVVDVPALPPAVATLIARYPTLTADVAADLLRRYPIDDPRVDWGATVAVAFLATGDYLSDEWDGDFRVWKRRRSPA